MCHASYGTLIFMTQDIAIQLMGGLQQQSTLFRSVLMLVPFSQSAASSRKLGDTWMHIGMHAHDHLAYALLIIEHHCQEKAQRASSSLRK
jgi:hypothetical protein